VQNFLKWPTHYDFLTFLTFNNAWSTVSMLYASRWLSVQILCRLRHLDELTFTGKYITWPSLMSSFFFLLASSSAATFRRLLIALLKSSAEWALTLLGLAQGKMFSVNSVRVHSSCWYVYIKRTSEHAIPSKQRKTRRQERSGIVATKELQNQGHRGTNGSSGVCIPVTGLNYAFLTFSCAVQFPPKYVF